MSTMIYLAWILHAWCKAPVEVGRVFGPSWPQGPQAAGRAASLGCVVMAFAVSQPEILGNGIWPVAYERWSLHVSV